MQEEVDLASLDILSEMGPKIKRRSNQNVGDEDFVAADDTEGEVVGRKLRECFEATGSEDSAAFHLHRIRGTRVQVFELKDARPVGSHMLLQLFVVKR